MRSKEESYELALSNVLLPGVLGCCVCKERPDHLVLERTTQTAILANVLLPDVLSLCVCALLVLSSQINFT